jgi:tetratricopeptide (TPR) repeat protein
MEEKRTDIESMDAQKVDEALKALSSGDVNTTQTLLLSVIANTPSDYSNILEDDEGLSIKFWDAEQFLHYITWQKKHGLEKVVKWIPNAYPRAHYYMGFLFVKTRQFSHAVEFLDKGLVLESTNPKFKFEKALAIFHSGRAQEALALYDEVNEIGPYVNAHDLAAAKRGCGFLLIEMGRLDEAEAAFKTSLEFEPKNETALHELKYIKHLRKGGAATKSEMVQKSTSADLSICAICKRKFETGVMISLDGKPVSICMKCRARIKSPKKWWQFWK